MRYIVAVVLVLGITAEAVGQEIIGSPESITMQHSYAEKGHLSFMQSESDVKKSLRSRLLFPITLNPHVKLHKVSFPYGLFTTQLFVDWFAKRHKNACGVGMTITSGTRPRNRQPSNAHKLSVHPTGMAVDIRIPATEECEWWMMNETLWLESLGVIDVTREFYSPHFHIAVFPERFLEYWIKGH